MKKTKMEKGITLIALIITIVVLLILAVVTIGAIRESSIITHAQNASNDYTVAQEKEQIQLALSEWQIQKNILGNTKTFKNVMESELSSSATVGGKDDGPVTITFTKTGNRYKVTEDGTINELAKLEGNDLEKYIFGEELQGRDLAEIINLDEDKFYDENLNLISAGIEDPADMFDLYFKYNNETYKFKFFSEYFEENDEIIFSSVADYGLAKIEVSGKKVGKTVRYDGKIWTILYDDDINGLQMVSNEAYKYNNSDFCLGYNDSLINDWSKLDTTTDEFKNSDLDKNGVLDTNLEKSIYSYNNAITTLNTACESIVAKNDNIIDVRCVGSNPTNKNAENETLYTSENLAKLPENDSEYSAGIGNGRGKSTDSNSVIDLDRMVVLGIDQGCTSFGKGCGYWLASRTILKDDDGDRIKFTIDSGNGWSSYDGDFFLMIFSQSYVRGGEDHWYLRPVVKLKSDVQFSGSGTADDPYTF